MLSVIICTHNPRPDYLRRTLEALQSQTLPKEQWELLLIDNASKEALASQWDLSWHPQARHVREEELGLTSARLRGIKESQGELLTFVDDDNLLAPDYLEESLRISGNWPMLGAWGGSITGEFDESPPEWTKPYWTMLAIRSVEKDIWSNDPDHWIAQPCGAGMCVRRCVAELYANDCRNDPAKLLLDRRGGSLSSCGDSDLAQTSCKLGLGFGVFRLPTLKHMIPRSRLTEDYLVSLYEKIIYSQLVLRFLRNDKPPPQGGRITGLLRRVFNSLRLNRLEMRFYLAGCRARRIFDEWVDVQNMPLKPR